MSYGIIRIQKFHSQAVKGIEIHDTRAKDVSHTNEDIDRARSSLNYSLASPPPGVSYLDTAKQNIAALNPKKATRKDAVVMCQALITSDNAFFKRLTASQERQFFEDALEFIKRRYGAENVISATIHKDEKTPHMHINFTPIKDKKLSAKAIFNKIELTELQTAFTREVGTSYDLARGESREIKRKHLSTEIFKVETGKMSQDYVSANDVVPRVLEKGIFTTLYEGSIQVANRINAEIINPLVSELRNFQLERRDFYNSLKYYKKTEENYKKLTQGLPEEKLKQLEKKAQELKEEVKQERIQEQERKRYRGMSR